jgi:hypothetical protein
VSHTVRLAVLVRGTDVKFNVTEESAALMSVGLHATGQERTAKCGASVEKEAGLVTDGALSATDRDFITSLPDT